MGTEDSMVRRSVLLAATATMAGAFSPATTGGITRLGMPSRSAVSSLRGGSSRGVSSMQMASAHDFKLPLVGGGEKSLGDYKGKVVLIENVASL